MKTKKKTKTAVRMKAPPSRKANEIKSQFFKIVKSGKKPVWSPKQQKFVTKRTKKKRKKRK